MNEYVRGRLYLSSLQEAWNEIKKEESDLYILVYL